MNDSLSERDRMIELHHHLCARAARKFMRRGIERCDLVQVAAIGLIKATDRFDAALGTPFEAYAWRFILGELMHYVRDAERLVRAPRRVRDLARRCGAAEGELRQRLGREPSDAEIAAFACVSTLDLHDVRCFRENDIALSFDALGTNDRDALAYTIDAAVDRVVIDRALASLSPTERTLLREIYENDTPIVDVARKLGYSRRHVTRLHRSALEKLAPYACHRAV